LSVQVVRESLADERIMCATRCRPENVVVLRFVAIEIRQGARAVSGVAPATITAGAIDRDSRNSPARPLADGGSDE
jgi:hypothetical protein